MKTNLPRKCLPVVLTAVFVPTVWTLWAQRGPAPCTEDSPAAATGSHPASQSPMRCDCGNFRTELRSPVTFPDDPIPLAFVGAWEGDDPMLGQSTQIGIFINVDAILKVRLVPGAIERGFTARPRLPTEFCLYERTSGNEQRVCFEVGEVLPTLSSSLDGQRLQARFKNDEPSGNFAHTEIAVDLTFDQQQLAWTGQLTRNSVTKQVRLERPKVSSRIKESALVGTWALPVFETVEGNLRSTCLSIAQGNDGALIAWEPSMGYQWIGVDGAPPPEATFELYAGRRWGITVDGENVTLDRMAYMAGAPGGFDPGPFVGRLWMCGRQILGSFGGIGPTPSRGWQPYMRLSQAWSKQSHGCVELLRVDPRMAETATDY